MNDIQKHLIKLLQEIDDICSQNNIPYLLCGRIAKDACQNHHFLGDYVSASVMMRGQDFDKFRDLVANKEGRAVESIQENSDFPDCMTMRYVDETTTFIYGHTARNYRRKGIFITIQKCRNIPKNKIMAKLANGIDKALAYVGMDDISGLGKKKRFAVKCLRLTVKLLGKAFVIKCLLGLQQKLTRSGRENMAYVRPMKNNIKIPASMFTDVQRVELEGAQFPVPTDIDKYLEKVYGKNWEQDNKPENISTPHLLVSSTKISYKEVDNDDSLYAVHDEVKATINKRKSLMAQINPLRRKIEKYWDLLFLTKERYRLYRLYMPVAEILEDRLSKGEYEWLEIAMADYLTTLKTYLSKKLPLTICPALDRIVLELLNQGEKKNLAQKFNNLKNKVPLKSVELKLDEGTQQEALANLPATISYDENNAVPVFLRHGEKLRAVALKDENGQVCPVLVKKENEIVSAFTEVSSTARQLVVESDDNGYEPLIGGCQFEGKRAIALIQHIYGRDLELAWLDEAGKIYIAAQFDCGDIYSGVDVPEYLSVGADLEVPVCYYDDESKTLREVFCVDSDGSHIPVVTLGSEGLLCVTADAAKKLHYRSGDGQLKQLTVSCFEDEAYKEVMQVLYRDDRPQICCKLVQKDAFGRMIEVAALYNDECVRPLVRVDDDRTVSGLDAQN